MGKMFSGIVAAIFMASGLTALTIGGAAADPYAGTINTICQAHNLNNPRVGDPARVKFRVGTDGNGSARGNVTFKYVRRSNGTIEGVYRRAYVGPDVERYAFRGLPQGNYKVRVHFNSKPANSVYQDCQTSFRQTVRAR